MSLLTVGLAGDCLRRGSWAGVGQERAGAVTHEGRIARGSRHGDEVLRIQRAAVAEAGRALDLENAASAVLGAALSLPGLDAGAMYIADPAGTALHLAAHDGIGQELVSLTPRAQTDARTAEALWTEEARRREGLRCATSIALNRAGRLVGVLHLASHSRESIDPSARAAAEAIASAAAEAMDHLRSIPDAGASLADLRCLLASVQDLVVVVGADATILYAGAAAEARLGYAPGDLRGQPAARIHPRSRRDELAAAVEATLRHGAATSLIPLVTRDGVEIPAETRYVRGHWRGRPALVGVSRDITERVQADAARGRLEEQLRLAQKMEALGQLAGGVAHDFNSILQMVTAATESALSSLDDASPARQELRHVLEAAERGSALSRQLTSLGRPAEPRLEALDLHEVAAEMSRLLARVVGRHIELGHRPIGGPCRALADRCHLEQVLMNLVLNARDAMPEGGAIAVRTGVALATPPGADPDATDRYAMLAVTDSGAGIPPADLPRVFEPFFTTKRQQGGTGLGLATVYALVQQHDGFVTVESQVGLGSTFRVFLPLTETATTDAAPTATARSHDHAGRGERVLIIDSDRLVRGMAASALTRSGYAVVAAADGEGAAEALAQHAEAVDLALVDVLAHPTTGAVVGELLCRRRPGIPLVLTGFEGEPIHVTDVGTHRGPTLRLTKPYSVEALLRGVRALLDEAAGEEFVG